MLRASSFSVTFRARFSASWSMGLKFLVLTASVRRSVSVGSLFMASLKRFSASSSVVTSSRASSGQASMHFGSPSQRSHAMAMPVSGWRTMPPWGQA